MKKNKKTTEDLIRQVQAFYAEWAKRPASERRQGLRMALFKERRDLFRALQLNPSLVPTLPAEVLAGWFAPARGIGERQLEELMPQIVALYRNEPQGSFQAFLNRLLAKNRTGKALRQYLGAAG